MNHKLLLIIALFTANSYGYNYKLKGMIEAPRGIKTIPSFSVFYLGVQVNSNDIGFFTLPCNKHESFNILFIRNFHAKINRYNTVSGLRLNNKKPYKFYKETLAEDETYQWKQYNIKGNKIPENTVIVRMNPKLVDNLENWKVSLPDNFIKFPKIVLRKTITDNELKKASSKSMLYSLDEKPFHETVNLTQKDLPKQKKQIYF